MWDLGIRLEASGTYYVGGRLSASMGIWVS